VKKNIIRDERSAVLRQKIGNEACYLLLFGLLGSLLIQQYVYNAPFAQYAAEFFCFLGGCLYIVARNIIAGINLYGEKAGGKKHIVLNSAVTGLVISAVAGVSNYLRYGSSGGGMFLAFGITFLSGTAATFITLLIMHTLNRERQKKIAEKLDKEENDLE